MTWNVLTWNVLSIEESILRWGIDFAAILAEGIEDGLEELEYLEKYGCACNVCGEFRVCEIIQKEIGTPTDRGWKREYEDWAICEECIARKEASEPDWDSIRKEREERG